MESDIMKPKTNLKGDIAARCNVSETRIKLPAETLEPKAGSPNETTIPLVFKELTPYIKVIRPSRPSLTYDRME
jgi:hypothetical protein